MLISNMKVMSEQPDSKKAITRKSFHGYAGNGASAPQQQPFNLRGLWDSLPLSLFLQICGSAASREAMSTVNPDEDRPMGKRPSWRRAKAA